MFLKTIRKIFVSSKIQFLFGAIIFSILIGKNIPIMAGSVDLSKSEYFPPIQPGFSKRVTRIQV